jgi:signal transduction histidine kinase
MAPLLERRLRSLAATAPAALPGTAYFGLDWPTPPDSVVIAFDLLRDSAGRAATVYGVALVLDTVTAILGRASTGRRLLPRRLASRIPDDSLAGFRLEAAGRTLIDRGFDGGSPWAAETDLGPMFGHLRGRVALEPAQASRLVVGGLPRYQGPLLAGFLGLAIASLAALGMVVRRERLLQRTREDFVAGVSHELRTPLAQLRLFGETLALGRVRSDEERSRSLEIIRQETARLAHLVDNLLVFSRGERGRVALGFERTDLSGLVDRIVAEFVPLAGVTTARAIEPGVTAEVDAGAIRQVVLNLLDNAVKYGPPGQTIRIELHTTAGEAEIAVADEGPGVAPEERELVWRRFWRGPRATERGIGGTGIGLAIVVDLIRAHRGTVSVGAGAPRGARFAVRIPLEQNGRAG